WRVLEKCRGAVQRPVHRLLNLVVHSVIRRSRRAFEAERRRIDSGCMWARAAADLVIGAACSGCGRGGYIICSRCRHDLRPGPRQVTLTPAPDELTIPVWAAGPYRSPLRGALVASKEHGKSSRLVILSHVMPAAVAAAAAANPRGT